MDKMYTIKEAVKYIEEKSGKEFKERRMMYFVRREKVKAFKVGWQWVIPEEEVHRLAAEHK